MRRILVAALVAPFLALPVASPASAACARVPSDFNGDGYGDLAVGEPSRFEPVHGVNWQGAVHIAYGSATGMTRPATFDGTTRGIVLEGRWGSARFGESMAPGYLDGDCFADLAFSAASHSQFVVLYGSASGLTTARSQTFERNDIQPGGGYPSSLSSDLAAGDFNGDGFDDIAAGADQADQFRGAVGILYGSATGVVKTGAQWLTQDSPDVPGAAEREDRFGSTVAAGDFNGDGKADLAVSAPGEALGDRGDAGGVIVFPGTAASLATTGSMWWDQDSAGVPGTAEASDRFGLTLVAGDTDGDRRAELVVGVPDEALGNRLSAGMVQVFRGGATGLVVGAAFDQDDAAIPGDAEYGDFFGSAVALVDLNRDGRQDLAVGVAGETVGSWDATGAVNVLYSNASGPVAAGSSFFDQNSPGVPGSNENYDQFGTRLSRLPNAYGGDALVVGVPAEVVSFPGQGAVTVLPSAPRGAARPEGYFFSAASFPGGASRDAGFGTGLP